jgi:large subunit ribosomal protein L13
MDMGAYVVVINAEKVTVTGRKFTDKTYFRHTTGRPGSWKIETFDQLQKVSLGPGQVWGLLGH